MNTLESCVREGLVKLARIERKASPILRFVGLLFITTSVIMDDKEYIEAQETYLREASLLPALPGTQRFRKNRKLAEEFYGIGLEIGSRCARRLVDFLP